MSVLDRKLARELWASVGLLSAIAGIIIVGVVCFVALGSAYNNLQYEKQRYYRQCRMADFWIDLKKVPLAELEPVATLPGVAALRSRVQFQATVSLPGVVRPMNAQVISMPDRRGTDGKVINDIVLRQGGYFTAERENQVILNDAFARHHKLRPGDWIHVVLNNRRQELHVVGTAISSEFVYLLAPGALIPDPEQFGVFYIKRSYAEDVFDFDGAANQVIGRLAPGARRNPEPILDEAKRMLAPYGVFTTTPLSQQGSNMYLSQEIQGLAGFAFFMPMIFLAVAALVLNVLLSRLADQQRTTVGTLKALGYSNRQVFAHFLKFGLTVGIFGGLIGCVAGYWLAGLMTVMYREFFEFPRLDNHFYPGLQLAGLGISVACAVVGSLRGTRQVLRLEPAAAMRPKPPRQGGAIVLEHLAWLWRRLGSGWRMVVRGVVRNHGRTLAGVFAAAMGAAVLVSGFMMAKAGGYLVDFQYRQTHHADFELSFKDERGRDALDEIGRLPGVERAEPVLNVACEFFHGPYRKRGGITGLRADAQLTTPRDVEGQPVPLPEVGLTMTRKMAEILHVSRGETITFQPITGLRRRHEVPVVHIADSYLGTAVYADIEYLSHLVGEELAMTGVQLTAAHQGEELNAFYRELKRLPALQAVSSQREMVAQLEETLVRNMWGFIGFLVLFAGVVFFSSILNSSLVSLAERRRELATLRVLGYGPWMIGSLLLRESVIVSIVGTLVGMPLGFLLTVALAQVYDSEMFRFPVVSTVGVYVGTLALGAIFTLAAHLFVQRSVNRTDWLEALQAKE